MTAQREVDTPRLILLLGGARAGKSARALSLAQSLAGGRDVMFVATAQPFDDEMRQRIARHRAERSETWETLESFLDLAGDIESRLETDIIEPAVIVIDCLTLWVSNILLTLSDTDDAETLIVAQADRLLRTIANDAERCRRNGKTQRTWIVISNEVGLGIVPPTALGRRYRDALGRVNQVMAAAAEEVSLLVAGLGICLKSR